MNEHVAVSGSDRGTEDRDDALLRSGLRALPRKSAPPIVQTRLQVVASRERSRLQLRRTLAMRFSEFRRSFKVTFDNLLKPLAFPTAGGVLASFLCFGVLVDNLHIDLPLGDDIPIGFFTSAVLDTPSPFSTPGKDVMVQLTLDEQGAVRDFSILSATASSADEMREIGNLVLYSSFHPATRFGKPVSSKIVVNIQHVRVRG